MGGLGLGPHRLVYIPVMNYTLIHQHSANDDAVADRVSVFVQQLEY